MLAGFRCHGYDVAQRDLAIDLILNILSRSGMESLFNQLEENYADVDDQDLPECIYHFLANYADYYQCVDAVIGFLQGKVPA